MSIYDAIMAGRFGDLMDGSYGRDAANLGDELMDELSDLSIGQALRELRGLNVRAAGLVARLESALRDRAVELYAAETGRPDNTTEAHFG